MASNSIPTSEKTTKCELPNLLAIFPVIAPTFSPQQFFSKPTSNVALSPVEVLHNFHKTIASTADKCLQSLHFSATQNPFLNKLLSFSSYIHNFSQVIHCPSLSLLLDCKRLIFFCCFFRLFMNYCWSIELNSIVGFC